MVLLIKTGKTRGRNHRMSEYGFKTSNGPELRPYFPSGQTQTKIYFSCKGKLSHASNSDLRHERHAPKSRFSRMNDEKLNSYNLVSATSLYRVVHFSINTIFKAFCKCYE